MKNLLPLLSILLIFPCFAQESQDYSARVENGLIGKVKKVKTYILEYELNKTIIDTSNYIGNYTMSFDEEGNLLKIKRLYYIPPQINSEYYMFFSGKGRDISYKDSMIWEDGNVVKNNFKYHWTDDFNYIIETENDSLFTNSITLNENFNVIKTVYSGDDTETTEELETQYKNGKIKRINNKITEVRNGVTTSYLNIQLMQKYDNQGNPTLIYTYNDSIDSGIREIIYKEYEYY